MKRCKDCKQYLPLDRFWPSTGKRARDGLAARCVRCARSRQYMRRYGIDLDTYEQMVADQKSRCAICRSLPVNRALCVDHDHETGEVRGLLCHSCNTGLGFIEVPGWLDKAKGYLGEV